MSRHALISFVFYAPAPWSLLPLGSPLPPSCTTITLLPFYLKSVRIRKQTLNRHSDRLVNTCAAATAMSSFCQDKETNERHVSYLYPLPFCTPPSSPQSVSRTQRTSDVMAINKSVLITRLMTSGMPRQTRHDRHDNGQVNNNKGGWERGNRSFCWSGGC